MHSARPAPTGFLTITLHAHLPWVINHGTWPHGMEWLHEAAAETYLPLLRVLAKLERDGISLHCNLNLSPVLLEQLTHPVFRAEFPKYLERKIASAREDEAFFLSTNEPHYAETARFWQGFFTTALADFHALGDDIVCGFRGFYERGRIDILTCGATHGYMPLLGTDESVRAQVRTAVKAHKRHIGSAPKGIWAPECGYRPAGVWSYPVPDAEGATLPGPFPRIGVEQAIAESGLDFFFVDTHLVEESARVASPYERQPHPPAESAGVPSASSPETSRSLYHPYFVAGPYTGMSEHVATTVFPRDPRTGIQVWSGEHGYPGDPDYLDFHKKRWPGGHRYWRVTGANVDMYDKAPYDPAAAAARALDHAGHFAHLVWEALHAEESTEIPPVLCSPFDAELFGHWWFEGPIWLEAVARKLHDYPHGLEMITCADYLQRYPRAETIAMHEGSWGAEGTNHVWMNSETSWTYARIYPAELFCREACTGELWKRSEVSQRLTRQLCRELLLLESSDWQFLITTGAARDYAELRFNTHHDQFNELKAMWLQIHREEPLSDEQAGRLRVIEERDSLFADIDPTYWAAGSHDDHGYASAGEGAWLPPSEESR